MKSVKEILKQDKLPKGYPPTMEDVKTREKHVPESVRYNMKHFKEHGENAVKQLDKLKEVSPSQAKTEAHAALKVVEQVAKDIKEYC